MVRLTFKLSYTDKVLVYNIPIDYTFKKFIQVVSEKIKSDLLLEKKTSIYIIESGQYNNVVSRNPEDAPAIEPSDMTLYDKFGINLLYGHVSFYIRIKNNNHLHISVPKDEYYINLNDFEPSIKRICSTPI